MPLTIGRPGLGTELRIKSPIRARGQRAMLYVIIDGKKEYLSKEIVEKYGIKAESNMPFTGFPVCEDEKKDPVQKT